MPAKIEFIEPSAPAPIVVARWLASMFDNPRDMSDAVVILPTRSAIRAVSFALLDELRGRGIAAFGGLRAATPEDLISRLSASVNFANEFESYAAWAFSLKSYAAWADNQLKNSVKPALFPRGIRSGDDIFPLAEAIASLQKNLSEAGLDISSAAEKMSSSFDSDRWRELAKIEAECVSRLGRKSPKPRAASAALEGAKNFRKIFCGARRLIIAGVPDMSRQFSRIVEASDVDEIVVGVIASRAWNLEGLFDEWGRPSGEWLRRATEISETDISIANDIRAQADMVVRLVSNYGEAASRSMALACSEPDSSAAMTAEMGAAGIDAYLPSGASAADSAQLRLLADLRELSRGDSFDKFSKILRNPSMLDFLSRRCGISESEILAASDEFLDRRLPDTFGAARELSKRDGGAAARIFETAGDLLDSLFLSDSPVSARLENFFNAVFQTSADTSASDSECAGEVFEFLSGALKSLAEAEAEGLGSPMSECLDVVLSEAERRRIPARKTQESIALLDWVEIFWAPQSHVVLADMNDGIVPQSDFSDTFIPDSARAKLAMRDSATRHARDAYMLSVLIESRKNSGGRVSAIVPRRRGGGDPAAPSRLLMQCADSDLPRRVSFLFSETRDSFANIPFGASWIMRVPFKDAGETLSVSAFKDYLNCPFRFYLGRILKMKPFEAEPDELSADKIGNLAHEVMRKLGKGPFKDCADAERLERELLRLFDAEAESAYGKDISAAVRMQLYSLRLTLSAAAAHLAKAKSDGWRTTLVEEDFDNLEIGGFKIKMRVDRIDERGDEILIVDYKTKANAEPADKAHRKIIKAAREEVGDAGAACIAVGTEEYEWTDLQLPLYAAALQKIHPDKKIICAHFLLPSDAEDVGFSFWEISPSEEASALERAEEIAADIRGRKFSPALKAPKYDNYRPFFDFADGELANFLEFEK